jgi:GT2 family glycosyltransferase
MPLLNRGSSARGTLWHVLWIRFGKAVKIYRGAGIAALWYIVKKKYTSMNWPLGKPLDFSANSYKKWIRWSEPNAAQLKLYRKEGHQLNYRPKITVLLLMRGDENEAFRDSLKSIESQVYNHWEISKTTVELLNQALKAATGEFVLILKAGDILAPQALFEVVKRLNDTPQADLVYSDEDKLSADGKARCEPHFKPGWSPALMRSYNYLGRFCVIRKSLAQDVGGFISGYDGAEDYDFLLRLTEQARHIEHIAQALCHVGGIPGIDNQPEKDLSGQKAVERHLQRCGSNGRAEIVGPGLYRVRYAIKGEPKISIIIPNKDKVDILRVCLESIFQKTAYPHYEICVIDNQSREPKTSRYYDQIRGHSKVRLLSYDKPYNYSSINNFAVSQTDGQFLLFLNNDTEVISQEWLSALLEHAQQPEVGAVGALLYYPNGAVQHAGVVIGKGGGAWHLHKYFPGDSAGYFGRIKLIQNFSAVTAACLMTRREIFNDIGGFDEKYARAFNDVDFCLRLRERGYLVVYTPYAQLYHHESFSRGSDYSEQSFSLFRQAIEDFEARWARVLKKGDPYHNPNLSPSGTLKFGRQRD